MARPCRHARGLHPGRARRQPRPLKFPGGRVRGDKARRPAREDNPRLRRHLRGRLPRQDHRKLHGRTDPAPRPHGMQRVPRRDTPQHRQQPAALPRLEVQRDRGRRIRPLIPPPLPFHSRRNLDRPRPSRHLRQRGELPRRVRAFHVAHPPRRHPHPPHRAEDAPQGAERRRHTDLFRRRPGGRLPRRKRQI